MIRELLKSPRGIHISILFLSLFTDTHFGKKQGDFGILTSCIMKDKRLRIDCYYPPCNDNAPFKCEFKNSMKSLLGSSTKPVTSNDSFFSRTKDVCHLFLNESAYMPNNTFHCMLTRRKRTENKTLTVTYGNDKERPKPCSSAMLLMQEAQGLLWSIALHILLKIFS